MLGGTRPPFSLQNLSADVHAPHCEDWGLLIVGLYFKVLSHRSRKQCSAFTSPRFTGVTKDVASARPSRPVRALRTAAAMKRRSSSVLGKKKIKKKKHLCFACVRGCSDWSSTPELHYYSSYSDCVYMPPFVSLRLSEDRVGDICNACVLLVKRWKKLPNGSKKNWNHVSDVPVQHVTLDLSPCFRLTFVLSWIRWWMPELDQDLK